MRSWTSNSKTCADPFELCLHDFPYFLPGSGHHSWNNPWPACLQNPPRFFLRFPGSESMRLAFAAPAYWNSPELRWLMNCLERGRCLPVHFHQLQSTVLVFYRINWISKTWAHGITFLTWRKENRNVAGNKQSKKIQKKPWLLQFITDMARSKVNRLSGFLLK